VDVSEDAGNAAQAVGRADAGTGPRGATGVSYQPRSYVRVQGEKLDVLYVVRPFLDTLEIQAIVGWMLALDPAQLSV
jgi:hypothetical protein